jgi:hypothetical protein
MESDASARPVVRRRKLHRPRDPAGSPYSVPLNYIVRDGKLYIDPAEGRDGLDHIRADPRVRARGYLAFLASFLSFFSLAESLGLLVFAVRFLFLSLDMGRE